MSAFVLGIDACPAGWAVCRLDQTGGCALCVVEHIESLGDAIESSSGAYIDMPIGIPSDAKRCCDSKAKTLLGRHHARVFMTPAREVFEQPDYQRANALSKQRYGGGLSKQMWNIMPKVRSLDALLQRRRSLRQRLHECHPEIALWGLGGEVIASNKATPEGKSARVRLLRAYIDQPEHLIAEVRHEIPVKHARDDDLTDAMICAVTAAGVWDGTVHPLDKALPIDDTGLAMNIWYRNA